jgi:phospholipid/cholesterol/gamma-HCH transport system substrate-binding protein
MSKEMTRNIRLGFFVVAGLLLLISSLYMIGSKRNLFNSTIKVNVTFHNVNGLIEGNNVRFNGIDVGTVSKIQIASDTILHVELVIDKNVSKFISSSSIASIGTDGLMGNKLVNITPGTGIGKPLEEGISLSSIKPIDMDETLRTLSKTNDNLQYITSDIKSIAQRISAKNTLWSILMDSSIAKNLKQSVSNITATTQNASNFSQTLNLTMTDIKNGKGTLGKLLNDTTLSSDINQTVANFNQSSKNAVTITNDLNTIVNNTKKGEGTVGSLLKDTITAHNLNSAIVSLDKGAQGFNENMEALKHNFLFRKYFRNKEKTNKKK